DAELSANAPRPRDRRSHDRRPVQALLRRRGQSRPRRDSRMGVVTDLRMNERAWALADRAVERAAEMRLAIHTLSGGARVIDAGIDAAGGFDAGLLLAELCMGGLGRVSYTTLTIDGDQWPGVEVWTDHPAVSCMASQYAGWAINPDGYF